MCVDVEMREGDVWTYTVYIDRHAETQGLDGSGTESWCTWTDTQRPIYRGLTRVFGSGKVKMIVAGYRSDTGCSLPIDRRSLKQW